MKPYIFLILLLFPVSAFAFETTTEMLPETKLEIQVNELMSERAAQTKLPLAKDPLWNKLLQCKTPYSETTHQFSIALTDTVKKMAGKKMTIDGFMYPLEFSDNAKTMLLSRRTPVCFFCPPGDPNEVIFVELAKPLELTGDLIKLTGTFELVSRKDEGIFFVLKNATLAK